MEKLVEGIYVKVICNSFDENDVGAYAKECIGQIGIVKGRSGNDVLVHFANTKLEDEWIYFLCLEKATPTKAQALEELTDISYNEIPSDGTAYTRIDGWISNDAFNLIRELLNGNEAIK